jgi:hypothetical protein
MSDIKLPIGPFRGWLEAQLVTSNALSLASRCGVSAREMQRWLHDADSISFVQVDDALTSESSTAFWELGVFSYDAHGRQVECTPTHDMEVYRYVAELGDLDEPEGATVHGLPVTPSTQLGLDLDLGMAA